LQGLSGRGRRSEPRPSVRPCQGQDSHREGGKSLRGGPSAQQGRCVGRSTCYLSGYSAWGIVPKCFRQQGLNE
jgi:hypothetical protein